MTQKRKRQRAADSFSGRGRDGEALLAAIVSTHRLVLAGMATVGAIAIWQLLAIMI